MWEYRLYICLDFFIFFQPQIQQKHWTLLLDSLVVECWLRVREVPGSIPNQGPRHTKDVIKMVPVVLLFGTQHYKVKYWLFLKNKDRTKNGMDKIWDYYYYIFIIEILRSRRSLAVVARWKNQMITHNRQKSNAKKEQLHMNYWVRLRGKLFMSKSLFNKLIQILFGLILKS
mgnify:CR=1 FL=1